MNRNQEYKEYKALLKKNEQDIKALQAANVHIKAHLKFLEVQGVESEAVGNTLVDARPEIANLNQDGI